MAKIYFDVTDVVQFATRYNRLTGIQRVQLNIVRLLARAHGDTVIRCAFFDSDRNAMYEFSPEAAGSEGEFDAESMLIRIGLVRANSRLPSKVQVRSYLRRYHNNKLFRAYKKVEVYVLAVLAPSRLERLGLTASAARSLSPLPVTRIDSLPLDCTFVCMGSMWLHPEVGQFARQHGVAGGDVVQMVHDLIPVSHPHYYTAAESAAFKSWLQDCLTYVSRFIAVSNNTGAELLKFAAPEYAPETRVIKLAHEFMGYERNAEVPLPSELESLQGKRFVICVGTIEARKNAIALLDVWRDLSGEFGDRLPLLLFAGKYGKGSADFQKRLEPPSELNRWVQVVHAPSDRDLAWLYRHSMFTVLPSLIEGWGLPVGEGAWFGKFCVASRTTSLPEVCGDLMEYVDPTDLQSIKAGIRRAIEDREFLAARERAIAAAELRTWKEVAEDIYGFVSVRGRRAAGVSTLAGR